MAVVTERKIIKLITKNLIQVLDIRILKKVYHFLINIFALKKTVKLSIIKERLWIQKKL